MENIKTFKMIGLEMEHIFIENGMSPLKADVIECGGFVPAMILVLCNLFGRTKEVTDFVDECIDYFGLSYNELSAEIANRLFGMFKDILEKES